MKLLEPATRCCSFSFIYFFCFLLISAFVKQNKKKNTFASIVKSVLSYLIIFWDETLKFEVVLHIMYVPRWGANLLILLVLFLWSSLLRRQVLPSWNNKQEWLKKTALEVKVTDPDWSQSVTHDAPLHPLQLPPVAQTNASRWRRNKNNRKKNKIFL